MLKTYPRVLGELETLRLVAGGKSIARYGDGELKMCYGGGIKSQEAHPRLSARLREILEDSGDCLVGIPNLAAVSEKTARWQRFARYADLLVDRPYVSSFITRPDSAPGMVCDEYWALCESLWIGRDVTLVRGSQKSLTAEDLLGAGRVTEILAPRQHAFVEYSRILKQIGHPDRVILCLGPTATVMAADLCAKGIHAIDFGHGGMFYRKHQRGDPMWVEKADKSVEGVLEEVCE